MKRTLTVVLMVVVFAVPALAWGPATHAYIASRLNSKPFPTMYNQMYGAVLPDVNLLLGNPLDPQDPFFLATHYQVNGYGFLDVWQAAQAGTPQKPLAYGFTSHNEQWGADFTAHKRSLLYGNNGYVILKAKQLCAVLKAQLAPLGLDTDSLLTTDNCHFVLEYGVDLLMKAKDPAIGQKLVGAANNRSPQISALLVAAYGLEQGTLFAGAEPLWRLKIAEYGNLLNQPNAQAVPGVAAWLADIGSLLGILPSDPTLPKLIELALVDSMILCAPDFGFEVDGTVWFIKYNFWVHRISY